MEEYPTREPRKRGREDDRQFDGFKRRRGSGHKRPERSGKRKHRYESPSYSYSREKSRSSVDQFLRMCRSNNIETKKEGLISACEAIESVEKNKVPYFKKMISLAMKYLQRYVDPRRNNLSDYPA